MIIELDDNLSSSALHRAFKTLSKLFTEMSQQTTVGFANAEIMMNDPLTKKEIGTITTES